jgi:Protein of unknown function (DUF3037)
MRRYVYSLVRCVPDPRTGEFVNVAAIAGDPETGDWSLREVSNQARIRKLAGPVAPSLLGAVARFLGRVGNQIDDLQESMLAGSADLLNEDWLGALHHDHRNVVQVSAPTPILAEDAEEVLNTLFSSQVIDPVGEKRARIVTKHRVMSDLLNAYRRAQIDPQLVRRRVELFVGDRVHTGLDFAVANGSTVQISQGWSFQVEQVDAVAEQVKAWAYALSQLRKGINSRVVGTDEWISQVGADVDLEIVVVPPRDADQRGAYEEAEQVFSQLDASVRRLEEVDAVGRRAAELLGSSSGWQGLPFGHH